MGTLGLIGLAVLLVMVINLRGRVTELEKKMRQSGPQPAPGAPPAAASAGTPAPVGAPAITASSPAAPIVPAAPIESENRFLAWLKENWLLKLRALLLLIGFGWLVSYAFLNNWIGP